MRRRAFLGRAVSLAGVASLAGCSTFTADSLATLDQIVLRADTGHIEPLFLTLVYAPRDDSTERPVWGTYEVPASGQTRIVDDFEGSPGFYSLTAYSENHDSEGTISFNSYGDAVGDGPLQFQAVVKRSGSMWTNLSGAGDPISIPGYDG